MKPAIKIKFGIALVFIGLTAAILVSKITETSSIIPENIKSNIGFTVFEPQTKSTSWQVDKKSVNFSKSNGVLTYTMLNKDTRNKITITQQNVPDPFNDIPNYKTIFLSKLNEYDELNLPIGTVALTRPSELKGGQSAVLISKNTLMFLHPANDLSEQEWRQVFNNLADSAS